MTDPIQLHRAALATKPELQHQEESWRWLQANVPPEVLAEFARRFRATPPPPEAVALALPLIKEFEGCSLKAYPDPGTGGEPWTIGWGTTTYYDGQPVKETDTISQALADELLANRVKADAFRLAKAVPTWRKLNAYQQAALLSFSYNVGAGWYGNPGFTTITAQVQDFKLDRVPAALRLYVNPGSKVEAGLKRRREAEIALWNKGAPAKPVPVVVTQQRPNPLPVPYFPQRDSATDQGLRMCFSSSCAMLLAYLKPGVLKGANGDDQYLATVRKYGDTTSPQAQIKALAQYGLKATFTETADFSVIRQQIDRGIPVPFGWIHRGPITAPTGEGHWSIAIGYTLANTPGLTPSKVTVHDPWGDPDLINGGTISTNGKSLSMTCANLGRRWMVKKTAGAWEFAPGHGWAIIAEP